MNGDAVCTATSLNDDMACLLLEVEYMNVVQSGRDSVAGSRPVDLNQHDVHTTSKHAARRAVDKSRR